MTVREFYLEIAGNYEEATKRLMNDALITRFIQKFLNDPSFAELKKALEANDCELAFRQAHTLKGVSANLAFDKLAKSSSEITELLRAGKSEEAKTYFPNVLLDYELVVNAIGKVGN